MTGFEWRSGEGAHIRAGGKTLETVCYGPSPKAAPTIVLLHEGLGCIGLWRDFPEKLTKVTGFGVFVYSRAGYGGSDPVELPRPLDYMSQEAMDVLPEVLAQISFECGILMGHSDGASIAAIYAGAAADHRVRGLVLMAPHFFTEPEGLKSIADARDAYEHGELRQRLAKYHKHVDNAFKGWNEAWLSEDFKDWNIAEVIDYWRVPVLAVQGEDDQYGTLAQISEIESRIYSPLDVAILPNCKHSPYGEQPEKTLGLVAEFCKRLMRIENEGVAL